MHWVLEQLQKHGFYPNLKKCQFYEDELQFLDIVIFIQGIKIKEERIKTVKTWPKPQTVKYIKVFLDFVNFYRRFIKNFNRIALPLISMLQTIGELTDKKYLIIRIENQDILKLLIVLMVVILE